MPAVPQRRRLQSLVRAQLLSLQFAGAGRRLRRHGAAQRDGIEQLQQAGRAVRQHDNQPAAVGLHGAGLCGRGARVQRQ